jgi:hypothetical protein
MSSLPQIASRLLLGLGVALTCASCTKDPAPRAAPSPAAPAPSPAAPAPAVAARPAPAAPDDGELAGTVVETMRAGGYTYAKIDRGGAQVWAAGPETELAVGARITGANGMVMTGFHSDTLKRTFDQIYFVSSFKVTGGPAAVAPAAVAPAVVRAAPAAVAVAAVDKIAPVAGGKTIAEVFAGKAALAGKPVAVRGKAVKVNDGIMGKNWVHLQDGTGGAGSNDLIITTSATVAKGAVVVARGTVAIDKDLGAGYRYAVLIEDAAISDK